MGLRGRGFRTENCSRRLIESGNVAYVCLSQTRPLNSVVDSLAFSEIPIRWAKVTVSDGQTTEVLTGRIDTDYTPPFIYREA